MGYTTENSEILHYKRGIYFINKLLKLYSEGYDIEKEKEFVFSEFQRFKNFPVANFDLDNFYLLCFISLFGLNKELIEESKNINDYKYKLDYSYVDKFKSEKFSVKQNQHLDSFNNNKIVDSEYDEWLSVNKINSNPNYIPNYLFNIRNGLMHSEYNFDMTDENYLSILNVKNSNYTKFESSILLIKFIEFVKHYFSNNLYFGIVNSLYKYEVADEDECTITNDEELLEFLIKDVKISKIIYDNKLKASEIFEKKINNKNVDISKHNMKKYNINFEDITLTNDQIKQIYLSIKSYYKKDEFYALSYDKKMLTIIGAIRNIMEPQSVISSWIMHFYIIMSGVKENRYYEEDFNSFFVMKPALLILKSYLILYRLQNQELGKYPIDYTLMDQIDFSYEQNHYQDYKLKLSVDGIFANEDEYMARYFTHVFRNSLAHGHVEILYEEKNDGEIVQYLKFTDSYKNRARSVTVSVDELSKYLSSSCYNAEYLKVNKVKNR